MGVSDKDAPTELQQVDVTLDLIVSKLSDIADTLERIADILEKRAEE